VQCEPVADTGLVNAVSIFHVCLARIELAIWRRMVVVGSDDHEIGTDRSDGSDGSDVSVVFVSVLFLRICVGVSLPVLSVAAWAQVGDIVDETKIAFHVISLFIKRRIS
jgi:hypothetical protein